MEETSVVKQKLPSRYQYAYAEYNIGTVMRSGVHAEGVEASGAEASAVHRSGEEVSVAVGSCNCCI